MQFVYELHNNPVHGFCVSKSQRSLVGTAKKPAKATGGREEPQATVIYEGGNRLLQRLAVITGALLYEGGNRLLQRLAVITRHNALP